MNETRQHLTINFLDKLINIDPQGEEVLAALEHLKVCERCRSLLALAPPKARHLLGGLSPNGIRPQNVQVESYSNALEVVFKRVAEEGSRLDRERQDAPALLGELELQAPGRQAFLIRNSRRFQTWAFAEFLLGESQSTWTEDPSRSERIAELALLVSEHLDLGGFRREVLNDLRAEAWSFVANCRRIRGDFQEARKAFRRAEECLGAGTSDPMERARLLDLRASYLRALQRFTESLELLEQVISVYRRYGEKALEGKALLTYGKVLSDAGRISECLPVIERSAHLLRSVGDPWLQLMAEMLLIDNLNDAGRPEEAHARLPQVRELARQYGNRLDRLRLLYIEGLICRSLGQLGFAEEALKQVRAGFIDAEIGYDVALVSLDLAALYLETGRTAEVKELAAEMLPQFAARQIHREALAAIALFEQAARKERATLALVQEISAKVKDASTRRTPVEKN